MSTVINRPFTTTKKIRLCNSFNNTSDPNARKQESIGNNCIANDTFEWDDDKINLLIFGYVREHVNFAIRDS